MFFDYDLYLNFGEGARHFSGGAAKALGQSLATLFMPWMVSAWGWLCGRKTGALSISSEDISMEGGTLPQMASELKGAAQAGHWDQVVTELKSCGVPIDKTASEQLEELRNGLIKNAVEATQGLTRLGTLTAEAFERAGIGQPDLQRWQNISDRLRDDAPEPEVDAKPAAANVGVAKVKRPSTWFVWSRQETDRRYLRYTQRAVRNCRTACEQALAGMRDLPSLRQVRELNINLGMIEDLIDTTPPLEPRTARFRLDSQTVKSLLKSLEEAVLTTEQLTQEISKLFLQNPATTEWKESLNLCLRSTSKLAQLVRDRRTVR